MSTKFLPAILWLAIITYLSTQGGISVPEFNLIQMDKVGHATAYCLLVWLLLFGWYRFEPGRATWAVGLLVFLAASGYGILMEFVQFTWFPNRHFEVDDMLANAFGAAIAWMTFDRLKQFFRSLLTEKT
ncbi:MAG: VanZ family protein [Saprospiraceae bacterium]|nr:VanZ family protein [Saprospiraceae bacterium]